MPECERPVYARRHCARHYRQVLRHGAVQPDRQRQVCAVASCDRPAAARGWCQAHYLRWVRKGDVQADLPLAQSAAGICTVEGCGRPRASRGLCHAHRQRLVVTGAVQDEVPLRVVPGDGSRSRGYVVVPVPPEDRWLTGGTTPVGEHRLVIARALGRPLRRDESVHHRNGLRDDNRLDNLELWTRFQPTGARVQDKLAWAWQMLRRYDPEAATALGLEPLEGPHDEGLCDESPPSG